MKKTVINSSHLYISTSGLGSETLRFAFVTDLHNQVSDGQGKRLLEMIRTQRPDAILCGGDMIVGKPHQTVEPALQFMLQLAKEYPVYCGTGNHEYRVKIYAETYPGMYEAYHGPLREAGVVFLENQDTYLCIRGIPIVIYGYDMDRFYYERFKRRFVSVSEMRSILGEPDGQAVSVLLAHNPAQMNTYFRWGADLTLCGHYHGGIVRLGEHRGLISPDFRLFPDNVHGLYEKNGKKIIVSAGLGEHTLPVRIHNPRELVMIELTIHGTEKNNGYSCKASGV